MEPVTVTFWDDVAAFRGASEGFLLRHEAQNNLLLGMTNILASQGNAWSDESPVLVTAHRGDATVAVAIMTPPHRLQVATDGNVEVHTALAEQLLASKHEIPGVGGALPVVAEVVEEFQRQAGCSASRERSEGIYALSIITPPTSVAGRGRLATRDDMNWLLDWLSDFGDEIGDVVASSGAERMLERRLANSESGYAVWEDGGRVVSIAGFGRTTPNGGRIGPVFTPRTFRGHGYASSCTAFASQQILDRGGRFCFLYTDMTNPTSNKIYQAIGYELVCEAKAWNLV